MTTERRKYRRIDKKMLGSYEVIGKDEVVSDEGMARALNLSYVGLHLELNRKPAQGDILRLMLSFDGQLISLDGHVVWVRPGADCHEVGLQITHVPKSYRTQVQRLLQSE